VAEPAPARYPPARYGELRALLGSTGARAHAAAQSKHSRAQLANLWQPGGRDEQLAARRAGRLCAWIRDVPASCSCTWEWRQPQWIGRYVRTIADPDCRWHR